MNNKKTFYTLLGGLLVSGASHGQWAVLDPANLVENTVSAIQEKLSNGNLRDQGKVQKSQLKADNQTTAEVIGIGDATNTNLNLDMSQMKYSIEPSTFFKSYMNNKGFNSKLSITKGMYNRSVGFYNSNISSMTPQKVLDGQAFLNAISEKINTISKNATLAFNATSTTELGNNNGSSFDNGNDGAADDDAAYNAAEKLYDDTVNEKTKTMEELMDLKEKLIENKGADGFWEKFGNVLSLGTAQKFAGMLDDLNIAAVDKAIDQTKTALNDAGKAFKSSVTGGILGSFGGTANQKGTGQKVTITAPNGLMNDNERVALLHEYLDMLDVTQNQLVLFNNDNLVRATALFNKTEMLKYQTKVTDLYKDVSSDKFDKGMTDGLDGYKMN